MSTDDTTFGRRCRSARDARGLSRDVVTVDDPHISPHQLYLIEKGRADPRFPLCSLLPRIGARVTIEWPDGTIERYPSSSTSSSTS